MELSEYKELLLDRYLRIIFKPFDASDRKNIKIYEKLKKIVNFNGNINDVVAYADYEPTNKKTEYENYAIFTKDAFYGVALDGRTVFCKYKDIYDILKAQKSIFSKKKGLVNCGYSNCFWVTHKMMKALHGFMLINNLKDTSDKTFDEFLIDRTTKIFGEILEWRLSKEEHDSIEKYSTEKWDCSLITIISYSLKLKELTLTDAFFQITIKDNEIKDEDNPEGIYWGHEWEDGVVVYNSDSKIKKVIQQSLLNTIGVFYELENIHFYVKCKTTLSTRINKAIEFGYDVQDYMYRSVESAQRNCKK